MSRVAQALAAAGFEGLVSVMPPEADHEAAGKMPGINTNGRWHGYSWSKTDVPPETIDESGANVGIRAALYPGLDIDSESPGLTLFVMQEAFRFLGPAPVRQSRAPRALLMYRADEEIKKQVLTATYEGQTHAIELLAKGQQYVIRGTHPSGSQYRWESFPASPEELTLITADKVRGFLHHLGRLLEEKGLDVEITGAGKTAGPADPIPDKIIAGARNDAMASIAGTFRQRGLSKEAAWEALLIENRDRCHPPLPWPEVKRVLDSIYSNYEAGTLYEPRSTADEDFAPLQEAPPPRERGLDLDSWNTKMRHEDVKPHSWLLEGLIGEEGASMIVAKPKVGKSTVSRALAIAVARGDETFMGKKLHRHGPVIYISFKGEGTESSVKREFHKLTGGEAIKHDLHVFYDALAPVDIVRRLYESVEDIRPALVVVDTFGGLAQVVDMNDYSKVVEAVRPLLELAGTGHLLFVHHSPKGANDGDINSMVQGSTAIYGLMESVIAIWRDKDDRNVRYLMAEGREVDMDPVVMKLDPETHEPSIGMTRREREELKEDEELLGRIAACGGAMRQRDLTHGRDNPRLMASITRLLEGGRLVREGAGVSGDPLTLRVVDADNDFMEVEDGAD